MADDTPLIPGDKEEKVGHRVFGCCCDSRRAVIAYSSLAAIRSFVYIILTVAVDNTPGLDEALADARIAYEDWQARSKTLYTFFALDIVVNMIAICGARNYDSTLVGVGLVYQIFAKILAIWFGKVYYNHITDGIASIAGAIIDGLIYVYISSVFIQEVKSGIMSPETWQREKSCGCGPSPDGYSYDDQP